MSLISCLLTFISGNSNIKVSSRDYSLSRYLFPRFAAQYANIPEKTGASKPSKI
jgi:hypothetical protein